MLNAPCRAIDSVFEVMLTVSDKIGSRVSTASSVFSIVAPLSPAIYAHSDDTEFKVNQRLKIWGQVMVLEAGVLTWSAGSLDISSIAVTPTVATIDDALVGSIFSFNLVLKAGSLRESSGYVFSLQFKGAHHDAFAEVLIVTNSPPTPGEFHVVPKEGISMVTLFQFEAFGWQDTDMPLIFEFAFKLEESFTTIRYVF